MAGYIGNKAVGINVTTGDIRGDVGVGGDVTATTSDGAILNLNSSDTTITDGSVLGAIKFTAPLEGSGTDSVLLGAAIEAVAEGTFAADNNATELVFKTGASAAAAQQMTLTSGGDLLVGMTTASTNNDGAGIRADGLIHGKRADVVALFNRKTSDGVIVQFGKDNTVVGSIGTKSGGMFIGSDDAGIFFNDHGGGDDDALFPYDVGTNTFYNGHVDIGGASNRFRNLYLSGGVHLGGTGAANKLDDYEFGAWTVGTSASGYTISAQVGRYTKIGRVVVINFSVTFSAVNSSSNSTVPLSGLPFTSDGDLAFAGSVREQSTTGAIYSTRVAANSGTITMNSMDGVSNGTQRTIRTSEVYTGTISYIT